jgi:hypothetical protein
MLKLAAEVALRRIGAKILEIYALTKQNNISA